MKTIFQGIVGLAAILGALVAIGRLAGPQTTAAIVDEARHVEVRLEGRSTKTVQERISRAAWGERWPFTVDEAVLICVPALSEYGSYFVVGDRAFAATGGAALMAEASARDVQVRVSSTLQRPVLFQVDRPGVDELWAFDHAFPHDPSIEKEWRARVSVGSIITALNKLGC